MEERLRLHKGMLSIESQPKQGTTIHARVPLSSGGGGAPKEKVEIENVTIKQT